LSSANPLTPPRATDSILTLLQDAVKILMFQASDQRVEVTCLPPPDLAHTRAEGDLYHVFVNLIKNALQSMPQGGSLRIDGRLDESQVEVAFEDTGPGLSPQEQNHIFLPFYTTKGEGQGLGLGLPICRKILERYQGQLLVESRAGQGTRVRVILPRKSMGGNHAV
jgi:signal transduction histidine kinase